MSNALEQLGIEAKQKPEFARTLFYFIKELGIYPFDEIFEFTYKGEKITIKKKE